MDWLLEQLDERWLDDVYRSSGLARESLVRQIVSTYFVGWLGGSFVYYTFSTLDYFLLFDRRLERHKQFLPHQVRQEILSATWSLFVMAALSVPIWLLEVRGYSRLYTDVADYGLAYFFASILAFLLFTDTCIYWIHRWFHHPALYPYVHKEHHKWKVPTPYASIAFHPVDGWSQALPYHLFVMLFPMQRHLYLALFVFVQIWTVSIHDQVYFTNHTALEPFVNGADHHTEHHLKFNYNYGQFFTFWDKLMGTYLAPTDECIHVPEKSLKPDSKKSQ
jgi:lathosterol oxidase